MRMTVALFNLVARAAPTHSAWGPAWTSTLRFCRKGLRTTGPRARIAARLNARPTREPSFTTPLDLITPGTSPAWRTVDDDCRVPRRGGPAFRCCPGEVAGRASPTQADRCRQGVTEAEEGEGRRASGGCPQDPGGRGPARPSVLLPI